MTIPIADSRFAEKAKLIRQGPGHRDERGRWAPGDEEPPEEVSVVTAPPSSAAMRDVLPEGARLSETRTFWIDGDNLKPMRAGANATEGDVIVYEGFRYRVRHVEEWTKEGFVEALGVREDGQDD